jgi:hypothetical protein
LARLPRLAQTAAQIDRQIRLAGLTGLAGLATQSIKKEIIVVLLTWKSGLQRIRPTRKAELQKIQLTQKTGLYRSRGGGRKLEEGKGAAPRKGQLHGSAQGVLP